MKRSTLALAAVITVAVLVGAGLKLGSSSGDVKRIVADIEQEQAILKPLMTGCAVMALSNPQTALIVLATRGKVCFQVIQDDAKKTAEGKGLCGKSDDKCLFTVGYVKTAAALGSSPKTKEEVQSLQDEVDSAYEKSKPIEE